MGTSQRLNFFERVVKAVCSIAFIIWGYGVGCKKGLGLEYDCRLTRSQFMRRMGILTGGGEAPGLNAVIRAAVKTAIYQYGCEVFGIRDGYDGFIKVRERVERGMLFSIVVVSEGAQPLGGAQIFSRVGNEIYVPRLG